MPHIAYRLTSLLLLLTGITHAQTANRLNVLITEIMADPAPAISLPGYEWVELHNVSGLPFSLAGWRIGDENAQSGTMPAFVLKPDSSVILCSSGALPFLSVYGTCIAVTSFPSLDNDGELLYLRSAQGKIIHAIHYSADWYQNTLKKDGGWTLEMIDPGNPCNGGSNWKASTDVRGGTPGRTNSVKAYRPDNDAPQLLHAFAADSLRITLIFNEPLDSANATQAAHYSISDGVGKPLAVNCTAPLFDKVVLQLASPLQRNKVYTLSCQTVTDCAGNTVSAGQYVKTGWAVPADSLSVVVNELLFNPTADATDYVELYNRSRNIIDLKQLYIASRSNGTISNIRQLSTQSRLLFPGEYIVITEDPALVKRRYITQNPAAFIALASMPSFNDDKGTVVVLNQQGLITDELSYDEKWHFSLVTNPEGVSLERIAADAPTQQPDNWHSAASTVGYGTPGYKNSQYRGTESGTGTIVTTPEICSPDNDQQDDFVTISYTFTEPGNTASITIFDAAGRPVRYLQRNALCGNRGSFKWDGLGDKQRPLPPGIYIIYTETFTLKGKTEKFKNVVVLAR